MRATDAARERFRRARSAGLAWLRRSGLIGRARSVADRLPWRLRKKLKSALTRAETSAGRPPLLVDPAVLEERYRDALGSLIERHGADALGDYLEFGVFVGTSLGCMDRALDYHGLTAVRLFGFDSFEGLPDEARTDDEGLWGEPGRWSSDLDNTIGNLRRQGVDLSRTVLIPGWFEDTLTPALREQHRITHASVLMIDCDLYTSAKRALDFCAPLIRGEAIVFFDDWEDVGDRDLGEKRAFREFLDDNERLTAHDLGAYGDTGRVFSVVERL